MRFSPAICLRLWGLMALIGVIIAGAWSDGSGPSWPTAIAFAARTGAFGLIAFDQSAISIAAFVLVFGATFLVTAPMTVSFKVSERSICVRSAV